MPVSPLDLRVPPGPGVHEGLVVPAAELEERFSRAAGPGGQGVNTTDSRVQLTFRPGASTALSESQRDRIVQALEARLVDGSIVVTASEHRSQRQNRRAARERLSAILREALAPPPPRRRATRPTAGSRRRRLEAKKRRGEIKQGRRRVDPRD